MFESSVPQKYPMGLDPPLACAEPEDRDDASF